MLKKGDESRFKKKTGIMSVRRKYIKFLKRKSTTEEVTYVSKNRLEGNTKKQFKEILLEYVRYINLFKGI
jgi:hypothetical protein